MLSVKEKKSNFGRKTVKIAKINLMLWTMAVVLMATSVGFADLTDGLVAYYPFNDTANDESGNGNHGTLMGDATGVSMIIRHTGGFAWKNFAFVITRFDRTGR